MGKILFAISFLCLLQYQVNSQYLNRPIEPPRNLIGPASYPLIENPYNTVVPITPSLPPSSTTIITDCSPSTCKNLANTLQLMIVANLLQNNIGGSELALQLAAPIINDLFSSNTLPCGCANPFAAGIPNFLPPGIAPPSVIPPNIFPPNVIPPNIFPPNVIPPNIFPPNVIPPNIPPSIVSPNVVPPNLYSNLLPPNIVSTFANALAAGGPGLLNLL